MRLKRNIFFDGNAWKSIDNHWCQWKSMNFSRKKCCVLTSWTSMEVHEIPWISMDFHGHFRRHEDNGRNCISRMTCAADALCNPNNTYYSNIRTGIKTRPISSGGFKYVVFYMFYSLWEWKENPYQLPSNEIDSHNFLRKICREIKGIFCSYETGANVNNSNCNSSLHQVTSWNSSRNYVPVILDGL